MFMIGSSEQPLPSLAQCHENVSRHESKKTLHGPRASKGLHVRHHFLFMRHCTALRASKIIKNSLKATIAGYMMPNMLSRTAQGSTMISGT